MFLISANRIVRTVRTSKAHIDNSAFPPNHPKLKINNEIGLFSGNDDDFSEIKTIG